MLAMPLVSVRKHFLQKNQHLNLDMLLTIVHGRLFITLFDELDNNYQIHFVNLLSEPVNWQKSSTDKNTWCCVLPDIWECAVILPWSSLICVCISGNICQVQWIKRCLEVQILMNIYLWVLCVIEVSKDRGKWACRVTAQQVCNGVLGQELGWLHQIKPCWRNWSVKVMVQLSLLLAWLLYRKWLSATTLPQTTIVPPIASSAHSYGLSS